MENLKVLNKETLDLLKKHNLIDDLIYNEIVEETIKNIDISIELEEVKKDLLKKENLNSEDEFKEWLSKANFDEQTFFKDIITNLKIKKYSTDKFSHLLHSHYLRRKSSLDQISYSLLRVTDLYLARELYFKIEEDPSCFGELAQIHSIGPEKDTLGLVGPNSLEKCHPKLADNLKSLQVKELSPPFPLNNCFLIVRVESINESKLDDAMELILAQELFRDSINEKVRDAREKLQDRINSTIKY